MINTIKKNNILLSIITITKNDNGGLNRTIKSIKHDSNEIEIIIVDGSDNFSTKKKKSIRKLSTLKNIKILHQESQGIFDAMNKGLIASEGKYVIFMNGGDEFHKDFKFKKLNKIFERNYEMIIFQTLIHSKRLNAVIGINPPIMNINNKFYIFLTRILPSIFWPSHQSCFFKSKLHKDFLYDLKTIGSDQKVIKYFLKKKFILINKICCKSDTSGLSSIAPKTINNYIEMISDSIKLRQFSRVLRLSILFALSFFINSKNIDEIRLVKYKIVYFMIFLLRKMVSFNKKF